MSKPDPRIYELTCARLGVRPTEMVFVDDVDANIVAARVAGIHSIHHENNARTISELDAVLATGGPGQWLVST